MKKLFTLIALGSVALVSADYYNHQDQANNRNYYQQNQRQNPEGYYQRDDRNYQRDDRNYQRDDRNYQRNIQYDYQQQAPRYQSYDQNQQYYQQQGNQSYHRDQQRNYNDNYGAQNWNNQGTVSDQEINRKIQETLSSGWFSDGYKNVSFDVNNGNVNLRGTVDSLENKNEVEDSVRKIDGVRQVNNQITIVKENSDTYSGSQLETSKMKYPQDYASNSHDRELNAKIRDKLSNGWFSKDYETLVIKTTNGIVVISGTVDKPEDVQKINDQVKDIDGVKSVNSQLRVKNR